MERECSAVLSEFFAGLRGKKRRSSEFA
jgi:hypothetical protein